MLVPTKISEPMNPFGFKLFSWEFLLAGKMRWCNVFADPGISGYFRAIMSVACIKVYQVNMKLIVFIGFTSSHETIFKIIRIYQKLVVFRSILILI